MDGRIIKLSGQASVYIRCLEPFEEEDRMKMMNSL